MAWTHRLKLKDLLDTGEQQDSATVAAAAKGMHERLEKFRLAFYREDTDIEDLSDAFHTIAFIDGPAGSADVGEFDYVLNELYDWADAVRVWID